MPIRIWLVNGEQIKIYKRKRNPSKNAVKQIACPLIHWAIAHLENPAEEQNQRGNVDWPRFAQPFPNLGNWPTRIAVPAQHNHRGFGHRQLDWVIQEGIAGGGRAGQLVGGDVQLGDDQRGVQRALNTMISRNDM